MTDNGVPSNPLSEVANLYTQSARKHGRAPMGVGWKNADQQRLRFEKLFEVVTAPSHERLTINDLGCGYGSMFTFLDERLGERLERYHGYDISNEMLNMAGDSIHDKRVELIQSPIITREADYSFVSGTFNVKLETPDKVWAEYIRTTVLNIATMSRRGFAFNLFTTSVDWRQDTLYYADPVEWFEFCRTSVSRYVSLLHDYPLYEWTVLVRKPPFI